MLVKFEQNRIVQTTRNVGRFDKKQNKTKNKTKQIKTKNKTKQKQTNKQK